MARKPQTIHVFLDNSNVWGGACAFAASLKPRVPWPAIRLEFSNLFRLIESGRKKLTAVLAGSVPPECEALWRYARSNKYNTDLLKRVETETGKSVEQGVDEILHLKIANALIDHRPPQTLVIVTGDGHTSNFGTGFPQQAARAIKSGWEVEIWSWRDQLSGKYKNIAQDSGGLLRVHTFDKYYSQITFVEGGEFYYRNSAEEKVFVEVTPRRADPLEV